MSETAQTAEDELRHNIDVTIAEARLAGISDARIAALLSEAAITLLDGVS